MMKKSRGRLRQLPPLIARKINSSVLGPKFLAATPEGRERDRDAGRRRDQPWRAWYNTETWQSLRAIQLARQPTCEACRRAPATVAHHRHPHGGRWELFADPSNLQSVCKSCHDGAIQAGERRGNYAREIDLDDGLAVAANVLYPKDLRPSAIPLALVCGPPASGKTTYVEQHKQPGDTVIDLDAILAELAGTALRSDEIKRAFLEQALAIRNKRLNALSFERAATRAWFIVGAPTAAERESWATKLRAERVVVIETPAWLCVARTYADPNRAAIADELAEAARTWWRRYARSPRDQIIT